jgi:uncharacterized RDD family membrane protein YckC
MTHSPYEASDPYGQPPATGLPPTRQFGAYEPGVYGSPAAPQPEAPQSPAIYGTPAPSPGVYGTPAPATYGTPAPSAGPLAPTYGTPPAQQAINPYSAPPVPAGPYGAPVPAYAHALPGPHHRLVPPGGRLGAALIDAALVLITFGIGWLVWALIVWSNGQTPGKQLLGHVVADVNTGRPFGWGQMFVRDLLIRGLLFSLLGTVTFGVFSIVNACMVFGDGHRTLHDRMAGSIVRYADV